MRASKRQAGFTIVEVMIVTMIIGVLAALVLPSMRASAARARMSEALLAFGTCRNMVTEMYQAGGDLPDPGNWGCEITKNYSTYVDSINTGDFGKIVVSLRGFGDLRIDFHDVTLVPLDGSGAIPTGSGTPVNRWRCGSALDGTTVPSQFLPNSCRG
jgi:type IV pilus assembly protein PilA